LIEGSNQIGEESLDFLKEDNRVFIYKTKTDYVWGHEQRNFFIKNIKSNTDDWCYFLDDDNVVTEDLIEIAKDKESELYDVIVFSQKKGLTEKIRLYASPDNFKLGGVDIGSFILKYGTIKKTLISPESERNADGHYAEQIKNLKDVKIKYHPNKYVRYNALSLEIQ
jgi:hypothetical protein